MSDTSPVQFTDLNLPEPILKALNDLGYETPSPIQAECIPLLQNGGDVLGMAQTGTGKTAAFALPLLSNIDTSLTKPQILVLAPTRELAIQVVKGKAAPGDVNSVDGLSGATLTSRGVSNLVNFWLGDDAFGTFLSTAKAGGA